jgi:TonB family protein
LIRQTLNQPHLALVQAFHTSQLKQRIAMMTKKPSTPRALGKYLLALPLGLLLFFACEQSGAQEVQEVAETVAYSPAFQQVDTVITFNPDTGEESTQIVKSDVYEQVEQMPIFGTCGDKTGEEREQCSKMNLLMHVYENVTYPDAAQAAGEEGTAVVQFIVDAGGHPYGFKLVKSSNSTSIDAEALRAVSALPNFQPGMLEGKPVAVQLALPIKFKFDEEE